MYTMWDNKAIWFALIWIKHEQLQESLNFLVYSYLCTCPHPNQNFHFSQNIEL